LILPLGINCNWKRSETGLSSYVIGKGKREKNCNCLARMGLIEELAVFNREGTLNKSGHIKERTKSGVSCRNIGV
jgi:hypothetical protein